MRSTVPGTNPLHGMVAVLDALHGAIFVLDASERITAVNAEAASRWGRSVGALLGANVWEASPSWLGDAAQDAVAEALADGVAATVVDRSPPLARPLRVAVTPGPTGIVVHALEIAAERALEERLARDEAHYRRIFRVSGLIAARIDRDLRYVWIYNPHPAFDPDAVLGKRDYEIADNPGTHALVALKREVVDTGRSVRREINFVIGTEVRSYAVQGEPILDADGAVEGLTTVAVDVSDLRRVERAAATDHLTGAGNRRFLEGLLRQEMRRFARYGHDFSIIVLDVDHFKRVNDTHGHLAGDAVLKEIVGCLRAEIRDVDHIGRWGGEEFLILLPELAAEEAARAAERMRERVAAHRFAARGSVTISLGVAAARRGDRVPTLVARADAALYRAKSRGRNRVEREDGVAPGGAAAR